MVYHGALSYIMVYYKILWYIMVYYVILRYIMCHYCSYMLSASFIPDAYFVASRVAYLGIMFILCIQACGAKNPGQRPLPPHSP